MDDLKSHADIVQVVQERVPLRRSGTTWKGLCPFHGEKTPSFHVYDKGFFKCYGCGVGGDVIKFIELFDKVAFPEAVRQLAARAGLQVPEAEDSKQDVENQRERESLLKAHEVAAAWFTEQLNASVGSAARRLLQDRGVDAEAVRALGLGYAPAVRSGLTERLRKEGFPPALLTKSGLIVPRDDGSLIDRFRNRLMIPICRDNGAIIAFGGRAMESGQQPKYLNSPETPIYVKGRTLYGLHLSKQAISRSRYAVMVEGYFDFAQAYQAGVQNVVASSGTALTPAQARLLKRFASKVVLSFDPDAAGQGAAAKSSELLVAEGFQVNVAMMPAGEDPDTYIRRQGGAAYQELLRQSRQYLDYLLERAAAGFDFRKDDDRREFLGQMLTVAARIPDAAARDQFADRLAHRARITEEVVRAEIRKAAVQRETVVERRHVPSLGQVKTFERGLIWALVREPASGFEALAELESTDLSGLATGPILEQARSLQGWPIEGLPQALLERLSTQEVGLVTEITAQPVPPVLVAAHCVAELRRLQLARERADVQRQMDRLLEQGIPSSDDRINVLGMRQLALKQQIEALSQADLAKPRGQTPSL
ncbi:MAG: DNA primase [Vicinamibacterales bacterium]